MVQDCSGLRYVKGLQIAIKPPGSILAHLGVEERRWLLQGLGYALRGWCGKRVYILHGGGDAGKTTIIDGLLNTLGEYAGKMGSSALTPDSWSTSDKAEPSKFDVAGGKRIAIMDEPKLGPGGAMAWDTIKEMTGGKNGHARLLRENYVDLRYTATMVWAMNDLPNIPHEEIGDSGAVYIRLRVLPPPVYTQREARPSLRGVVREGPSCKAGAPGLDGRSRADSKDSAGRHADGLYSSAEYAPVVCGRGIPVAGESPRS